MSDYNFDYVNNSTREVEYAMDNYAASLGVLFAAEEALNISASVEASALIEADAAFKQSNSYCGYNLYCFAIQKLTDSQDAAHAAAEEYDTACAAACTALDNLLAAEAAAMYNLYLDAQCAVYAAEETEEAALMEADTASLPNHTWEEYQLYHQAVLKLYAAEDAVIAARELLVVAAAAAGISH